MQIQQLTVGMMGVCCYLVSCEETGKGVVIDPGGDEERILKTSRKNGIEIIAIIATHGHPDHVCGNRRIKEASGAEIIMHHDDAEFFSRPEVEEYFSQLGLEASPPVDREIADNDTVSFGKEKLTVIHTPGHTPGGVCLYSAPNLFTGDTLFVGGVGRTDFPGGSSTELRDSIKEKLLGLPGDTVIWPGHGYGGSRSTIAEESRNNPFIL